MGRACLPAIVAVCAGLAFGAGAADATQARPLLPPPGGLWQSISYPAERDAESKPASALGAAAKPKGKDQARIAGAGAAKPNPQPPREVRQRHPVAAAAVPERAPPATAAARARELARRLDVLMPGAKLGENLANPYNPSWRRARPGRPTGESNSLSLPFDDTGKAGFLARGYHVRPDVQNPHGNTGATFGLRQLF